MRSYALLIFALAVLHARAASIPAQIEAEKKLPNENEALDDVSLDNNVSEQELVEPVKEVGNEVRNSIADVPVKVIEDQPEIKTIKLKEDSNDYVPDNDDSTNIKRVEIDLNNPGPPQRQEHDSQNPTYYVDKERALAAVQKSIAESKDVFDRGVQDVTQNFEDFFANKEDLKVVQTHIQKLKQNVNAQVKKLGDTLHSFLKPEDGHAIEGADDYHVKEVENSLKNLELKFNSGVNMLSEGVEIISILKEEEEQINPDKISGKADNENVAATATGSSTAAPTTAQGSSTAAPPSAFTNFMTTFQTAVGDMMTNVGNAFQNFVNPNQNQNQNQPQSSSTAPPFSFSPPNLLQGINFPNVFPNQNQNQQPQGTAPAGAQSDVPATTSSPGIFQFIQNLFTPGQGNQQQTQQTQQTQTPSFPFLPFNGGPVSQFISNIFPQQNTQQVNQVTNAANQPASDTPVQVTPAPEKGSNSVPAAPAPAKPAEPAEESQANGAPVQGPIQQFVQNSPVVQGITNAVQRLQGLSNPNRPRDAINQPNDDDPDTKGHRPPGYATGDNNVSDGLDTISAPVKEPETSETQDDEQKPEAELNKTE